jgi:hypothetical protein
MPFYLLVGTVAMLAGGIASISSMGIGSLLGGRDTLGGSPQHCFPEIGNARHWQQGLR